MRGGRAHGGGGARDDEEHLAPHHGTQPQNHQGGGRRNTLKHTRWEGCLPNMRRRQLGLRTLDWPYNAPLTHCGLVTWWGAAKWGQAGRKLGHACHLQAKLPAGLARSLTQPTLSAPQTFCRDLSCADGTEGERWEAFAVSRAAGSRWRELHADSGSWDWRFGYACRLLTGRQFATCIVPPSPAPSSSPSPAAGRSISHRALLRSFRLLCSPSCSCQMRPCCTCTAPSSATCGRARAQARSGSSCNSSWGSCCRWFWAQGLIKSDAFEGLCVLVCGLIAGQPWPTAYDRLIGKHMLSKSPACAMAAGHATLPCALAAGAGAGGGRPGGRRQPV